MTWRRDPRAICRAVAGSLRCSAAVPHQIGDLKSVGSGLQQGGKITSDDQLLQRLQRLQPLRAAPPPRRGVGVEHPSAAKRRGRLGVADNEAVARECANGGIQQQLRPAAGRG
jgi:hypothetical protein